MPGVALVVHHVGAVAEPCGGAQDINGDHMLFEGQAFSGFGLRGSGLTCDGVLASVALLGHVGLEAVHAVGVVLVGSESSVRQRFTAGVAHEALGVPRVVLVADPSGADRLRRDRGHPELTRPR